MENKSFTREIVQERLTAMKDEAYREFHSGLLPGTENVLGVRTPDLRRLAKEICRGDWEGFLAENDRKWYENDILQGLVTAEANMSFDRRLELVKDFVPRINNWAVCDIFCGSLKDAKKHKKEVWAFLQPYLHSDQEYEIRFGVVMLLSHFVDREYLKRAFAAFDAITSDAYYVRMATAWAVSIYFVHFPEETFGYLGENKLDDWTFNKALQKIVESNRVDAETKKIIRSMKRKQHPVK